jgi:hypothetical protein
MYMGTPCVIAGEHVRPRVCHGGRSRDGDWLFIERAWFVSRDSRQLVLTTAEFSQLRELAVFNEGGKEDSRRGAELRVCRQPRYPLAKGPEALRPHLTVSLPKRTGRL